MGRVAILGIVALALVGCEESGVEFESSKSWLAVAGPWSIPPEVTAVGDQQTVTVTGAGAWRGEAGCGGSFRPGTRQLQDWITANWPQVSSIGGYSCRPINGNPNSMSVHATGRAMDIFIPLDGGEADNGLGDPLANWLVMHAEEIGIQRVIWDRWIWAPDRNVRGRAYNGAHPHHDHLHVELSVAAAELDAAWFRGPMGPPDMEACADPLPANGGTIDDTSPCFAAIGPAQFWRRVDGAGVGGRYLWTNAYSGDSPSNWARWLFEVSVEREYDVEVNVVAEHAVYNAVRYDIRHRDGDSTVVINPAGQNGWLSLGRFTFGAGEAQWVSVFDNYGGDVGDDQSIVADAIRLTVPEAPPPPPQDAAPPPPPRDAFIAPEGADEGVNPPTPDAGLVGEADQYVPPPRFDRGVVEPFGDAGMRNDAGEVRLPPATQGVSSTGGCQSAPVPGWLWALLVLPLGWRRRD